MRRAVPLTTGLFLAVFSFLPIANWIAGGRHQPRYGDFLDGWVYGTCIVVGVGLVLAIASRRIAGMWRDGGWDALAEQWERRPARVAALVSVVSLALYVAIARLVFEGHPILIDELVQSMQARIFAGGRLWVPTHAEPAFFSLANVIDGGGKYFGQFPPGWSALLAIGELIRAPWIVGPVTGALAAAAFAWYLRAAEPRRGVALGAVLLFAFSPFIAFMAGSYMNHVPALLGILVGMAAMAWTFNAERARPGLACVSGFGFGMAATMRPVDALAFALPAAVWYVARVVRDRTRVWDAVGASIGVAVPIIALLWYNAQTTGAPLQFGYTLLWGPNHSLGFHVSPWGEMHTPAAGAQLLNLYFLRLQLNLWETPLPSMLPPIMAALFMPRLSAHDRYLLAASAILAAAYFAYFHDGYYLGARFFIPLVPLLAWWTARLPALLRDRWGSEGLPFRTAAYGYGAAAMVGLATIIPLRVADYRGGLVTMRWNATRAAREAQVHGALVFVRESWGAQVIARMWRVGVSRGDTEVLYKRIDICRLELALTAFEASGSDGPDVTTILRAMTGDSARLVVSTESPDRSERMLPGVVYPDRCRGRLADDQRGFTLLGPLLFARDGNTYARDLHGRDTLLLAEHPGRPVYLLLPASSDEGAPPQFRMASRDSIVAAARAEHAAIVGEPPKRD